MMVNMREGKKIHLSVNINALFHDEINNTRIEIFKEKALTNAKESILPARVFFPLSAEFLITSK